MPQEWKDATIITIYKNKGDKAECGNSRRISLLSVAGKVMAKILLKRLIKYVAEPINTGYDICSATDLGKIP